MAAKLARRLAERGVRFIQLYHRGWDQHGSLPAQIGNQCKDTDQATAALIKDLKLKGSSQGIKGGTKSKPIRLVDGDHEISCKMDGIAIGLKACFVKKA